MAKPWGTAEWQIPGGGQNGGRHQQRTKLPDPIPPRWGGAKDVIRTRALTKRYGHVTAVDGLTLHVERGEIYGFLGPNGAGKTTTIMMLLGLEPPTSGSIELLGEDPAHNPLALRRRIGVLSEFHYLYEEMSAVDYLQFFADLYRVEDKARRIDELLSRLGLSAYRHLRLRGYSKGMKQKLGMARALLADPDLLILDEPVSSLDPYGIREIRDIILEENARGKTFLISSHILSEIERTCHRVGIIHHGRLLAEDRLEAIKGQLQPEVQLTLELQETPEAVIHALQSAPFVLACRPEGNKLLLQLKGGRDYRADVFHLVAGAGGTILEMRRHEVSLEDAFLRITDQNIRPLAEQIRMR